jgi:hypothetical protein
MKSIRLISAAAMVLGIVGCATPPPVELKAIGPNPESRSKQEATGRLEVFSALEPNGECDGSILYWDMDRRILYQHTDYDIYNLDGRRVLHVLNTFRPRDLTPRVVALPPGKYIVVAKAREALRVKVPVDIGAGRTSKVHLDDNWEIPSNTPKDVLVSLPSGSPVGWRAEHGKTGVQVPSGD